MSKRNKVSSPLVTFRCHLGYQCLALSPQMYLTYLGMRPAGDETRGLFRVPANQKAGNPEHTYGQPAYTLSEMILAPFYQRGESLRHDV